MAKLSITLLLLVGVCSGFSRAQNYCHIKSCWEKVHTACNYTTNTPAARCGNYKQVGLTNEEKKNVLDKHNELRQKVARGEEKLGNPGPQPAAKNMAIMEWDDELAMIAQKWANQCIFTHDSCRDVERYSVGQNLAFQVTSGDLSKLKLEYMVKNWYAEVQNFNRNEVAKFNRVTAANGGQIGQYTQLVWAKTTKVGCGAIKYSEEEGFNNLYLVCNYGPAGNVLGEPVYEAA